MTLLDKEYSLRQNALATNVINGTDGDDDIQDTEGDDVIYAGAGNDRIADGRGSDAIYGGGGNDTYVFEYLNAFTDAVDVVDLESGDDTAFMVFVNSQPLTTIHGGEGFDTLYLLAENVDQGSKVVDFRSEGTIKIGRISIDGFERYYLEDTEKIQTVYFTDSDDYFRGYGNFNTIYGGGGDDYIDSGEQGDKLYGEDGNDIIIADAGTNANPQAAFGGGGNDLIFSTFKAADYHSHGQLTGGDGSDGFILGNAIRPLGKQEDFVTDFNTAEDWIGLGTSRQHAAITTRLETPKYNVVDSKNELRFDVYYSYEDETRPIHVRYDRTSGELFMAASTNSDQTVEYLVLLLEGRPKLSLDNFFMMSAQMQTSFNDTLHGNDEVNLLEGAGGADTIYGLAGNDRLYGDGSDMFGFPGGNDTIYGGTGDDTIDGEEGDDRLFGDTGSDSITGGIGHDILDGGTGRDQLFGGSGTDTASYARALIGVVADLGSSANNAGEADGDTYSSIENLAGSAFADVLTGDQLANTIGGGSGTDMLDGGFGNDTLNGGAGADILLGGSGIDTASYAGAAAGVVVNLSDPSRNLNNAKGDTFSSIENLTGSSYADTLTGDDGANKILGGAESDTLVGGNGADNIVGGSENDILIGGAGHDVFDGGSGHDGFEGGSGNDVMFGGSGNDTFVAGSGNDTISGGNGNDFLTGSSGADIFFFDAAFSETANVDRITDFSVKDDTIQLASFVFAAAGAAGALVGNAFYASASGRAHDASDRIIYDKASGNLYYDSDGSAVGGSTLIAHLEANLNLSAADFMII